MLKRIIFLALIAGLVYLNYTTPKQADHQAAILAQLEQAGPIPEDMQAQIWKDADYSNFLVCSFMKTSETSKMISYGYLKKIKVINDKWINDTIETMQRYSEY